MAPLLQRRCTFPYVPSKPTPTPCDHGGDANAASERQPARTVTEAAGAPQQHCCSGGRRSSCQLREHVGRGCRCGDAEQRRARHVEQKRQLQEAHIRHHACITDYDLLFCFSPAPCPFARASRACTASSRPRGLRNS